MGSVGMPELIIILVIALMVFGPRKLPELGKAVGQTIKEFKKGAADLTGSLDEEVRRDEQRQQSAPSSTPPGTDSHV